MTVGSAEGGSARGGPRSERPVGAGRRVGHVVAVAVHVGLLYVVHHLLDWGWPGFLTADFDDVLPAVTTSLVASIVVESVLAVSETPRLAALGGIVTAVTTFVASLRVLGVFPFDFSSWSVDWSWALRVLLVVAVVGSAVSAVVNVAKLVSAAATGHPAADPCR